MKRHAIGCQIFLVRHGETEWSKSGRHTGRTDIDLTPEGEEQARALAPAFADVQPAGVFVSPLKRARRTAELAGLTEYDIEPNLMEWDYGEVEGVTTADWRVEHPGWTVWDDGVPGGELAGEVGARADRVLARVEPLINPEHPVVLVAHGHFLRVLTARWLGLAPEDGALFRLDPATLSGLGYEHERRVLARWNAEL